MNYGFVYKSYIQPKTSLFSSPLNRMSMIQSHLYNASLLSLGPPMKNQFHILTLTLCTSKPGNRQSGQHLLSRDRRVGYSILYPSVSLWVWTYKCLESFQKGMYQKGSRWYISITKCERAENNSNSANPLQL